MGGKKGRTKEEITREKGGKPESMLSKSLGEGGFIENVQLCQSPLEIRKKDTENFPLYLLSWRSSMAFAKRV